MPNRQLKALIVDDDTIICRVAGLALSNEGFHCTFAYDGEQASQRMADDSFDLVITDLMMPKKNGHALALEMLALDSPPYIVVLSAVDDPKMTKDLMRHGVDDIVFKPVNYNAFAAKMAVLVQRRREKIINGHAGGTAIVAQAKIETAADHLSSQMVTQLVRQTTVSHSRMDRAEYDRRLANVERLIPLQSIAYQAFLLANGTDTTIDELADTLSADAALASDILRLANSDQYNSTDCHTVDLTEAIPRIGFKPVGEVSLARSALSAFSGSTLPWLDAGLAQARSFAASIALEYLCRGRERLPNDGLSLCALLHPLGRLILGSVFRDEYQSLVQRCTEANLSLAEAEREWLPECHTAVIGSLLSQWDMPAEICKPLCHIGESYETVAALTGILRTRVEVLKLAIFVGNIAVGRWTTWDTIDPPPAGLLARHKITNLLPAIEHTRDAIKQHAQSGQSGIEPPGTDRLLAAKTAAARIAYVNLEGACTDWMPQLLNSLNVETVAHDLNGDRRASGVFVNCVNLPASMIPKVLLHDAFKDIGATFLMPAPGYCELGPRELTPHKLAPYELVEGARVQQFATSVAALRAICHGAG